MNIAILRFGTKFQLIGEIKYEIKSCTENQSP